MAAVPDTVLNWLYSVLPGQYADVNRTYSDVAEALAHYPTLSPKTKVYTYENGASALLLHISGTLPVVFRGTTYGFPIETWLPHAYPREAPMLYVLPSQDMIVRPGQHVSGDGRIYHPYLAQWGQYWDKSTLFDFFAVLRGVFAKEPPVRSRQQQRQPNGPATPAPPLLPAAPSEWRRSTQETSIRSSSPAFSSQGPAPPPKPPKPGEQSHPTPPPRPPQDRYSQPPPLPPHPHHQTTDRFEEHQIRHHEASHRFQDVPQGQRPNPSQYNSVQRLQGMAFDASAASSQVAYAQPTYYHQPSSANSSLVSPVPPQGQIQPSHQQPVQSTAYAKHPPSAQSAAQQRPPRPYQHVTAQAPLTQQRQSHQFQHLPPRQPSPPRPAPPPPNLMDMDSLSVSLPSQNPSHQHQNQQLAPPIPPNPQKDALLHALSATLSSQTYTIASQNHAAITPLRAQQAAIQQAFSTLTAELSHLQSLDAALASNESILHDAMREADRVMADAARREAPQVDDVLVAPTVVGGQLWTAVCEERALAETIFVLGAAVQRGRIGCEVFVKQTRSLAREQFLKKALVKKIAKGMGLDEYGVR